MASSSTGTRVARHATARTPDESRKLKNPQACIEDIEYRQSRGLDQRIVATLAGCDWIRNAQNVILSGPTGAGKTWVACAFAQQACRQGFSVLYVRVARLFEELKIAHGDGSFTRRLAQLAKMDVLLLDLCAARGYVEISCSKANPPGLSMPRLHITGQSLRSQPTRSAPFKMNAPPRGGARISGNTCASA